MIVTEGIKKTYITKVRKGFFKSEKKEIEAVAGLDLKIEPGKIVGLLGINGAGKTTTIKMLSTLLEPDGGKAYVDDMDLVKDAKLIKSKVNMIVGGERMLYWRLTARENMEYFGKLYKIPNDVLKKRIDSLISFMGLEDRCDEAVEKYSKGMKQRLQIARGLINDPKYIFMDEPTIGLDVSIARDVRSFTKKLSKEMNKGILLTSHYIKEIEELCDYVYVINKGRTIEEGTPRKIADKMASHKHTYNIKLSHITKVEEIKLEQFCSTYNLEHTIEKDDNDIITVKLYTDTHINGDLVRLFKDGESILNFELLQPSLEEAIINLSQKYKEA